MNRNDKTDQKLRVSTLTFQFTRNYGANLQAYALQKFLDRNGCDTQIVNYFPPYAEKKFRIFRVFFDSPSIRNLLRAMNAFLSNKPFAAFKKKHLKLTKECRTIQDIENLPQPDLYLVGSDQVWNPQLLGEFNRAYFLDFETTAMKASYAASAGMDFFSSEELDIFAQYAKRFDFVSVRETSFREMLEAHGVPHMSDHLDPVFLLDREDYRRISKCSKESPYILIYYSDKDNLTEKLALRLSELKGGIPVYRVGKQKNQNGIEGIQYLPIEEFLGMIDHAAYIVSCSFHACAFSIIFRKQFYAISAGERSSRLISLLNRFHLMDRFIPDENALNQLQVTDIDYSFHEDLIKKNIDFAKIYLKKVIDVACNRRKDHGREIE